MNFDFFLGKIVLQKTVKRQSGKHGIAIRPLMPEYGDLIGSFDLI